MPLINSAYRPPLLFHNPHLQTIYASFLRLPSEVKYLRERINTHDGDFVDLDWCGNSGKKLVVISHGMEGSSGSTYIKGVIPILLRKGFDCLAWNFRGCGGEDNIKPGFYHSGLSEDLRTVVRHVITTKTYEEIFLLGYSMGGNITLKYCGEEGGQIPAVVKKAAAISVPCDLRSSVMSLARMSNIIYMRRFLSLLRKKIEKKAASFPDRVSMQGYSKIKNFIEFDRLYTAPLHGFKSEEHYWEQSSSKKFITDIRIPTLLLSSKDDPFLAVECFPFEEASKNKDFYLEATEKGGHVGFVRFNSTGEYWADKRILEFFEIN